MIRIFGWAILSPAEVREGAREMAELDAAMQGLNAAVERSKAKRAERKAAKAVIDQFFISA